MNERRIIIPDVVVDRPVEELMAAGCYRTTSVPLTEITSWADKHAELSDVALLSFLSTIHHPNLEHYLEKNGMAFVHPIRMLALALKVQRLWPYDIKRIVTSWWGDRILSLRGNRQELYSLSYGELKADPWIRDRHVITKQWGTSACFAVHVLP